MAINMAIIEITNIDIRYILSLVFSSIFFGAKSIFLKSVEQQGLKSP